MPRQTPHRRADYKHFLTIQTRWLDNDSYGHVNNVVYYSYFDTVVNGYLIAEGALDVARSEVIGLVVETTCNYFSAISFPDTVQAGLRVAYVGNSSVRYEIGLFRNGEDIACAQGHFVHVYVDRASNKPALLPDALQRAITKLTR